MVFEFASVFSTTAGQSQVASRCYRPGEQIPCPPSPIGGLPWWPRQVCRSPSQTVRVAEYHQLWYSFPAYRTANYLPDGVHFTLDGYHDLGKSIRRGFASSGWASWPNSLEGEEVIQKDYSFPPILDYCETGESEPLLAALSQKREAETDERQQIALELNAALRDSDCRSDDGTRDGLRTEIMELFVGEEGLSFEPISTEDYESYETTFSEFLGKDITSTQARIQELEELDAAWEFGESSGYGSREENMISIEKELRDNIPELSRGDRVLLAQVIGLRRHRLAKLEVAVLSVETSSSQKWLSEIDFERQLLDSLSVAIF